MSARRSFAPLAGSVLALLAIAFLTAAPALAQRFETRAAYAILIDYNTGTVLFEKDADERMPPNWSACSSARATRAGARSRSWSVQSVAETTPPIALGPDSSEDNPRT